MTTAHFVVEGDFITKHARGLVLSNDPGRAWRMLRDSLGCDDEGQLLVAITGILVGNKRLTGDTQVGIELVDDDRSKRYRRDLAFIYAGRVRINGGWYRPAAKLEYMNPTSGAFAAVHAGVDLMPSPQSGLAEWWKRRAEWYCNDGEIPVIHREDKAVRFYVFEPCGEPPVWLTPVETTEDAVVQWLTTGHRLDNRCDEYDPPATSANARSTDDLVNDFRDALNVTSDVDRAAKRAAQLEQIRTDVLAQAKGDLFQLVTPDQTYSVPRAPFVCWALRRTPLTHLSPPWEPVSPWGLKMQGDDVYHSDWMVGCGFDIYSVTDYFDTPIMEAAYEAAYVVKAEYGSFKVDVLATAPECEGLVGSVPGAIYVLKDLSNTPENNEAIGNARAIITERGGALSHLSVIAREMKIPIFRVPDATKRFVCGMKLRLNAPHGDITVVDWKG